MHVAVPGGLLGLQVGCDDRYPAIVNDCSGASAARVDSGLCLGYARLPAKYLWVIET